MHTTPTTTTTCNPRTTLQTQLSRRPLARHFGKCAHIRRVEPGAARKNWRKRPGGFRVVGTAEEGEELGGGGAAAARLVYGGPWPRGGAAEPPLPQAPLPLRGLFLSRARRLMEVRRRSHPGVHWPASPCDGRRAGTQQTALPGRTRSSQVRSAGAARPAEARSSAGAGAQSKNTARWLGRGGRMVSNLKMQIHGPGHRARFTVSV